MPGLFDDFSGAWNDQTPDPMYGLPQGLLLQQAIQNLGNTSAKLMAAAQPGPYGQRAQILASMGDNGNGLKDMLQLQQLRATMADAAQKREQSKQAMEMIRSFGADMFGSAPSSSAPASTIAEAAGVNSPVQPSTTGAPMPISPVPVPTSEPQAPSQGLPPAGAPSQAPVQAPAMNTTQTAAVMQASRSGNVGKWTQLTGLPPEAFKALAPVILTNPTEGMKMVFDAMQKNAFQPRYSSEEVAPGEFLQRDQFGKLDKVGSPAPWSTEGYKALASKRDAAQAEANNIQDTKLALGFLNQAIAGPNGDFKLWLRNNVDGVKRMLGGQEDLIQAANNGDVAATGALKSIMGRMAAEKGRAIFGGGQGFTDKDRESVERWATGNLNAQDAPTIRRILEQGVIQGRRTIDQYNQMRGRYADLNKRNGADFAAVYPEITAPADEPAQQQIGIPSLQPGQSHSIGGVTIRRIN